MWRQRTESLITLTLCGPGCNECYVLVFQKSLKNKREKLEKKLIEQDFKEIKYFCAEV
jgi:hypothetical protein